MLTAPLELNPAPTQQGDVQPSLVFSYRGVPAWSLATTLQNHLELTTYCIGAQLVITNAHFNFGSSVFVRSFARYGFTPPTFGKVHLEFLSLVLDFAKLGVSSSTKSFA